MVDYSLHVFSITIIIISPVVKDTRILPLYSMQIIKGDNKGQIKGSGKPLLCILFCKKSKLRGRADNIVFLNPNLIPLSWLPSLRGYVPGT